MPYTDGLRQYVGTVLDSAQTILFEDSKQVVTQIFEVLIPLGVFLTYQVGDQSDDDQDENDEEELEDEDDELNWISVKRKLRGIKVTAAETQQWLFQLSDGLF